jgi:hypothetical protein
VASRQLAPYPPSVVTQSGKGAAEEAVMSSGSVGRLAATSLCAAALACGSESGGPRAEPVSAEDVPAAPGAPEANPLGVELGAFAAPGCAAPEGLAAPSNIGRVVDWVNALPKPLSLACFLETLARPLALYASESLFSAQPAVGRRSPRMFLFIEPLIMTITPDGEGRELLEFGERRSDSTSLKGEIRFPVSAELGPSAPYDPLIVDGITTCSGCHGDEEQDPGITFAPAFISRAIRPAPEERVGLPELHLEARRCDALAEPERCAMLVAVFGQGNVVDAEFPATLGTFY